MFMSPQTVLFKGIDRGSWATAGPDRVLCEHLWLYSLNQSFKKLNVEL